MEPVSTGTAISNSVMILLDLISTERATKLKRDHHELLSDFEELKSARYPLWSSVKLIKKKKQLANFTLAFLYEIGEELKAKKA